MTAEDLTRVEFLQTLALPESVKVHPTDATIRSGLHERAPEATTAAAPSTPAMSAVGVGDGPSLELKSLIARGGMGEILLAEQRNLRREVAVKTLRPELVAPEYVDRLLREAWITGLVEHPHVVPVHVVVLDTRGVPQMVMKRIEGVSWKAMLSDRSNASLPEDADDALAFHLGILMEVCDALSCAHSKGVVHLDVKPENVMFGRFRDVYLVDWGVAASTDEAHRGWLPMTDEIRSVVGTPAYMAPELTRPGAAQVGAWTDVFLLGATLFEVLTGRSPYSDPSIETALYAAYRQERPPLPPNTPSELAAIVERAMQPDPSRRFESAEAFRAAIRRYLRHRSAVDIGTKAQGNFERLVRAIDATRSGGAGAPAGGAGADAGADAEDGAADDTARTESPADAAQIQRLFGETRFGFRAALESWPENEAARQGHNEVMLAMAQYHLDRGEPDAALSLLDALDRPTPTQSIERSTLSAQARDRRTEHDRLTRLGADFDPRTGARVRALLLLAGSLFLTLPWVGIWALNFGSGFRYTWAQGIFFTSLVVAFFFVGGLVLRERLRQSRVSRQVVQGLGLTFFFLLLEMLYSASQGHDPVRNIPIGLLVLGGGCALLGTTVDRAFYLLSGAFGLGALLCALWPEMTFLWVVLAAFIGPGAVAAMWLRAARRAPS
ncbi:MAG: serine/threonine protein kinase [Myxococcales bacterium]|nr:serine/threonine protein kinase [Myxococcales bacterium]